MCFLYRRSFLYLFLSKCNETFLQMHIYHLAAWFKSQAKITCYNNKTKACIVVDACRFTISTSSSIKSPSERTIANDVVHSLQTFASAWFRRILRRTNSEIFIWTLRALHWSCTQLKLRLYSLSRSSYWPYIIDNTCTRDAPNRLTREFSV